MSTLISGGRIIRAAADRGDVYVDGGSIALIDEFVERAAFGQELLPAAAR